MGIGLAAFSYKPCMAPCLPTLQHLTIICLICPAYPFQLCPATSQPCDVGHSHFTRLMQLYGNSFVAWELVMADPTESKRRAEECRQLALLEPDEDDQAFWLRMAEEWERLASLAIRPREKASLQQNLEL
jgi:hypothetical protein